MSEPSLTEFLLARIAEDEAVARAAIIPAHDAPNAYRPHPALASWQYAPWSPGHHGEVEYVQTAEMLAEKYAEPYFVTMDGEGLSPAVSEQIGPHIARYDPARVLAECEAKQRIVMRHISFDGVCGGCGIETNGVDPLGLGVFSHPCPELRYLAAVYSDHPDYRQEWKP